MKDQITLSPKYTLRQLMQSEEGQAGVLAYMAQEAGSGRALANRKGEWGVRATGKVALSTITSEDIPKPTPGRVIPYEYDEANAPDTLYEDIYDITQDENLPETETVQVDGPYAVVLREITPGAEVRFGTVASGEQSVRIRGFAGAFEIHDNVFLYNRTWDIARLGQAFGRADVLLRNHLHLGPFMAYPYTGDRDVPYAAADASTDALADARRIMRTLETALERVPSASYLLCGRQMYFRLQWALSLVYPNGAPVAITNFLAPERVILYWGGSIDVGGVAFNYPGVGANVGYLITPKTPKLRSLVKQPLRIESFQGDMSRLIRIQMVATEHIGVYFDPTGELGTVRVNFA